MNLKRRRKILILTDKSGPKKEQFVNYLKKSLKSDTNVILNNFSNLLFEVKNNKVTVNIGKDNIEEYSLVVFRGVSRLPSVFSTAASLAISLDDLDVKYFDTTFLEVGPAGNKFTALIKLSLGGIPIPHSIFCWKNNIINQKKYIASALKFPIVAKGLSSQRGKNVFLLKNKKDFNKVTAPHLSEQFLFQEYISHEEEYRVLILGNKADVWEKKIKEKSEEFRHNISLGGKEEFLNIEKIPKYIKEISEKAAKIGNLQIAGVDVIVDKKTKKVFVLEVNRGPGITYNDQKSPELAKIALFLKNQLK
jgi:hypothetical protein